VRFRRSRDRLCRITLTVSAIVRYSRDGRADRARPQWGIRIGYDRGQPRGVLIRAGPRRMRWTPIRSGGQCGDRGWQLIADRDGIGLVATVAQLRAVLAVLHVDPTDPSVRAPVGHDAAVERAKLAGLLHRVASSELRKSILTATDENELARRWNAASTQPLPPARTPRASALRRTPAAPGSMNSARAPGTDADPARRRRPRPRSGLGAAVPAPETPCIDTESLWQTALDDSRRIPPHQR